MLNPSHRLLLLYDVHPERVQQYYLYMRGEFVPALQKMGLHMVAVWQVHGDEYPDRLVEFVCESEEVLCEMLMSERYAEVESRLKLYTTSYGRKVIRFENRFQF